jgi:hypothetical protein
MGSIIVLRVGEEGMVGQVDVELRSVVRQSPHNDPNAADGTEMAG